MLAMKETIEQRSPGVWVRIWWYDAERIASMSWVKGPEGRDALTYHGPIRMFDLDGRLVRETLCVANAVVSFSEYESAREADPTLPVPTIPLLGPEVYPEFQRLRRTDAR